jgi:hypothetical protein
MPRRNNRVIEEQWLPTFKALDERRELPKCEKFPHKTLFTTGYRAQIAVDEINARSDRDKKPKRVYECKVDEGGCGYFHTTSQGEYREHHVSGPGMAYLPDLGNSIGDFSSNTPV